LEKNTPSDDDSGINSGLNTILKCLQSIQTGFRKGYNTLDNTFSLHELISIYMSLGKKLYCTFVDFSKAFDTINDDSGINSGLNTILKCLQSIGKKI
jgi:hypothetical protein